VIPQQSLGVKNQHNIIEHGVIGQTAALSGRQTGVSWTWALPKNCLPAGHGFKL